MTKLSFVSFVAALGLYLQVWLIIAFVIDYVLAAVVW